MDGAGLVHPRYGVRCAGYLRHFLYRDSHDHEFVEPDAFINIDIGIWISRSLRNGAIALSRVVPARRRGEALTILTRLRPQPERGTLVGDFWRMGHSSG